ncbi:uncharacterized protein LOC129720105 [Wyeomyia smithii]|uniref:uncharacterized protein LOC129720105 n=1 Tax=Wyeomyia smithii TaxID=174621 RepID=UPI002468142E|nr:uncharacterized protein LOC129720105 [Wyeomyia smithii]
MDDFKELKKQERQLRSSIKAIAKFAQAFRKELHEKQIEVRLETLENAMRKFYAVRRKIELSIDEEDAKIDKKESADQRNERLQALAIQREEEYEEAIRLVEEEYFEVKATLIVLRLKTEVPFRRFVPEAKPAAVQPVMSKVKLPDINLPSFTGKTKDWVTFRDTFRSLIHNELDDFDKFTYLRSLVANNAFREISSIELTADNYEVAWRQLEKRFENKKLIVKAHLDAIIAFEPMRKENLDALSHLINEFDRNLQMLTKIGENPADWSTILAHMVCSRLDIVTLRQWETHHNSKEVPKYEVLIEFLRDQCAVLQSIVPVNPNIDESRRPRLSATRAAVEMAKRCVFCGDSYHLVFRCEKFRAMSVSQRVKDVNEKRLCRNCLNPGHFAEVCSRGSCNRCGRRHHTLLHYEGRMNLLKPANNSASQTQGRHQTIGPQPVRTQQKPQGQTRNTTPQTLSQQKPSTSYPVTRTDHQTTHVQPITDQHTTATLKTVVQSAPRQVLMSTAIVRVADQFGNFSFARTLLDSCSELCYMTNSFAKRLKFRESPTFLKVQGIGNGSITSTKYVDANIQPRLPSISSFAENIKFYVLPRITRTLPISPVEINFSHMSSELY